MTFEDIHFGAFVIFLLLIFAAAMGIVAHAVNKDFRQWRVTSKQQKMEKGK